MTTLELLNEFEADLKAHYEVCKDNNCKPENIASVTLDQTLERLVK